MATIDTFVSVICMLILTNSNFMTLLLTSMSSSVRLEAPIRVESNSLDLERTYAVDTTVYILNWLFRMHQDVIDVGW